MDSTATLETSQRSGIRDAGRPRYGSARPRPREQDPDSVPLPALFQQHDAISLATAQPVDIRTAADALQASTGIPVRISQEIQSGQGKLVVPVPVTAPLDYQGSLSLVLDRLAAQYDVGWKYDGQSIVLEAISSRSWQLSIPVGSGTFSRSAGGLSGGTASRSANLQYELTLDPWADLQSLLDAVLINPASATMAPGSGRVSVTGRPSDIRAAAAVIEDFQATYDIRIGLAVAVYYIDASRTEEFSLGLRLRLTGGGGHTTWKAESSPPLVVGAGTASLVFTGEGSPIENTSIDLQSLASDSAVLDYREGTAVTQSGTLTPIILTRSTNYVSSVATTTGENASIEIETNTVDEGISIHVAPRIISGDRIQLSMTLIQNDLVNLDVYSAGSAFVQLPVIDQRMVSSDAVLLPGETLVLSGYEQEAGQIELGGGILHKAEEAGIEHIRMVVVVRPALIPVVEGV